MNVAVLLQAWGPHYRTRGERIADGWVHAIGVSAGSVAALVLLGLALWRGGFGQATAVLIYGACLIVMLACSAAYNLAQDEKVRALLRRFDHAAIFLMIAGSYTPFTTQRFEGAWALWMTVAVWALALVGAAGKLFLPGISKKLWVPLYVALGWIVVVAFDPLSDTVPRAGVILLAVGGAIYTLGVAFYVWERLPYRRAIWHGFVLAAAGVHYSAILTGVVFAPLA
ncbi:MAG TPA: hemolysin III family protein [Caulobacterales bacterium]|nr:hemolysin III family protein [Caulobacterales bacterium]